MNTNRVLSTVFVLIGAFAVGGGWVGVAWGADINSLIRDLQGDEPAARRKALETLVDMGPDAAPAVSALAGVLSDPDELNRDYAITTLTHLGAAAAPALPALRRAAQNDSSADIRELARHAVEQIGQASPQKTDSPPVQEPTQPRPTNPPVQTGPMPLPPGGTAPGDSPAPAAMSGKFEVVSESPTGRAMVTQQSGVRSAQAALKGAVHALVGAFDAKPTILCAFADEQDRRGGATFRARVQGKDVEGAILAAVGPACATVSVVYDRVGADPRARSLLAAALPAPTGQVQWQQANIPDGSGSVRIPQDWRLVSGHQGMCTVCGPEGQEISLGIAVPVVTPELAEYRRRMCQQMGIPAPDMLVAMPNNPVQAYIELIPQFSVISVKAGQGGAEFVRLIDQHVLENPRNAPTALIDFQMNVIQAGSRTRHRAVAMPICMPIGGGQWLLHFSQMRAPISIFERDLPTMIEIWGGWNVSDAEVHRRISQATESINATTDILRRAREERAAHEAARDARKKQEWRGNATDDFDEAIRGWRTVEDTLTGEKKQVSLGDVDDIVKTLNEHEGWGRYRGIPLKNDW